MGDNQLIGQAIVEGIDFVLTGLRAICVALAFMVAIPLVLVALPACCVIYWSGAAIERLRR